MVTEHLSPMISPKENSQTRFFSESILGFLPSLPSPSICKKSEAWWLFQREWETCVHVCASSMWTAPLLEYTHKLRFVYDYKDLLFIYLITYCSEWYLCKPENLWIHFSFLFRKYPCAITTTKVLLSLPDCQEQWRLSTSAINIFIVH